MRARKALDEMADLLIAAFSLVAQLSAARLAVQTGGPGTDAAIRDWLQGRLKGDSAEAVADPPAGPLAATALAVTSAALNYERAAQSEAT